MIWGEADDHMESHIFREIGPLKIVFNEAKRVFFIRL